MEQPRQVLLVATMDTKNREAVFLREHLMEAGIPVLLLDAGIRGKSPVAADIHPEEVAAAGGQTLEVVRSMGHEGKALSAMIKGAVRLAAALQRQNKIHGAIGLGGSMGTTLGTAVMRAFPIGFPKVMISTMASRDTRAFVGTRDICMLHSVCDLSGLNRITRAVLRNGAMAMAGMLKGVTQKPPPEKPLAILSTLGTTEACVQQVRQHFEKRGYEIVTFHTVGSGGMAMEEMIGQDNPAAVIDISLHELADHLFGGDYDAGPARGMAALQHKSPTVLVPGNIDFLVAGPLQAALKLFPGRPYHQHNEAITVLRTNHTEMEILARTVAERCNAARGPLAILVPMGGFSAFDSENGPFPDPGARNLFARTLKGRLDKSSVLTLLPFHINAPEFAQAIIRTFEKLCPA
ncbi:MAG: Tm-1-like ATP-binding domain-containing protein [Desulfobacterales bacterium]|nr:Tm-1-like ATP-binding domain-containing protein [Desulfobacterales bacterium]